MAGDLVNNSGFMYFHACIFRFYQPPKFCLKILARDIFHCCKYSCLYCISIENHADSEVPQPNHSVDQSTIEPPKKQQKLINRTKYKLDAETKVTK